MVQQSTGIQCAVLSTVLYEPHNYLDLAKSRLKADSFSPPFDKIWNGILTLDRQGRPIEEEMLLKEVGSEYEGVIVQILSANPIAAIEPHIEQILEEKRQVEIQRFALTAQEAVGEGATSQQIIGMMQQFIDSGAASKKKNHKTFSQWAEYFDTLPELPRYKTGVFFLDSLLSGGFEMGQLVLFSGDAEAGKTSLGVQILNNVSKLHPVVFFSFEFTVRHFVQKQREFDESYRNDNLYIINEGMELSEVVADIKHFSKNGVKFFLIDSQMRIEVDSARTVEEEETRKFSTLAKLAHSLEVLIIFIVQTSKTNPDTPIGSKKGSHESSISIHITHIKPTKEDCEQDPSLSDKPFHPKKRVIEVKKNKQTGKHCREEIAFNPTNRYFYQIKNRGQREDWELQETEIIFEDGG